jgi:Xaa-Pro aminopeptidase
VEAYVVFKPGEKMTMHVEWYNHFPLAKKLAKGVDVRWGEHRGMSLTVAELKKRGAKKVGLMGPLVARKVRELEKEFTVLELDAEYVRLRLIKSEEEIDWLRIGAAFSDAGLRSLLEGTRPGMTERELGNLVERAYVGEGGTTFIHYIGVTPMAKPHLFVPPQFHSARKVEPGDVVFCELSGSFWDYSGQVLRTFSVGTDPTPLYRDLHATAEAAFDAVTSAVRHGATMDEILQAASDVMGEDVVTSWRPSLSYLPPEQRDGEYHVTVYAQGACETCPIKRSHVGSIEPKIRALVGADNIFVHDYFDIFEWVPNARFGDA